MEQMDEKKQIGLLFDRIADTYDRFNHILSLNIDSRWRRKAADSLSVSERVLDVAIGTADLAIELIKRNKAGKVTGLDLSAEMMKIGQRKVAGMKMDGRVEFVQGSALEMPFEESSFDAVTCAFGVRNFSDLDTGLREMFRVLKPGGQLMILEFSYPSNPVVRRIYDGFFTHFMPVAGSIISKDKSAYLYFRNSVKGFIWGEEMLSHISSAGFTEASFRTMSLGISTIYSAMK